MKNKNIEIKNIFYMLAYTFGSVDFYEFKDLQPEKFDHVLDLYIELLNLSIPVLIKNGLIKDYILVTEPLPVIKGKINLNESIKMSSFISKKLVVEYDDFTNNILFNQIIKSTILEIIGSQKIENTKKKPFRSYLVYFQDIDDVNLNTIDWNNLLFDKNNIRYKFIIMICKLFYEEVLISETDGKNDAITFKDKRQLSLIYENFLYELLKKETLLTVYRPHIKWNVSDNYSQFLPRMETDIVVRNKNKVLIIDAKYYTNNLIKRSVNAHERYISANLYQIFSYVNNWNEKENDVVSGALLYVRTKNEKQPNNEYVISGNKFFINNVNLNQDFKHIKNDIIKFVYQAIN